MAHPTVAQRERAALADLFDEVGPAEPTLDEGWLTADLLHHLIVRERRPDAMPGQFLGLFKPWTDKVMSSYGRLPWAQQVDIFRNGPQHLSPLRITAVDSIVNTGEYFIHHEDVRRGKPGWTVRDLDDETTQALMTLLRSGFTKLQLRKLGVGVRAQLPDRREFDLVRGGPGIVLVGAPSELILWVSGRRTACQVEVQGSPEALQKLDAD